MAGSERRYEPTIDLQGFDLTMNMDAVHEPSRLPLVVMIALVVLAAFGGVVWLAYTQGVERGRESVSRELTAQQFWKLRKPAAPAYTGLKIYEPPGAVEQTARVNSVSAAKPKVANAVPALRPTAAAPDTAGPQANPLASTAAPDQAGSPPALPEAGRKAAATPIKTGAAVPEEPLQRMATRAPTELTKPAPSTLTHPLTEPDSLAPAPAATPPAVKAPAAPAAKTPAPPAAKVSVPPVQKPAVPARLASAPVSAPATETSHAAAVGGILLQIGSYKSDSEARQSWQAFKSEHDAAAPYQPDVKQVELGAKGTWYRLRMGPFPDKSSALQTCRKLKADGASCLLAQ